MDEAFTGTPKQETDPIEEQIIALSKRTRQEFNNLINALASRGRMVSAGNLEEAVRDGRRYTESQKDQLAARLAVSRERSRIINEEANELGITQADAERALRIEVSSMEPGSKFDNDDLIFIKDFMGKVDKLRQRLLEMGIHYY